MERLVELFPTVDASLLEEVLLNCVVDASESGGDADCVQLAVERVTELTGIKPNTGGAVAMPTPVSPNIHSIVRLFSTHGGYCSYCGVSQTGRISFGGNAVTLTCTDYMALANRGWTRSGRYIYKPLNDQVCCPQHAIRLIVASHKLTKSQRGAKSRFHYWLQYGKFPVSKKADSLPPSLSQPPTLPSASNTTPPKVLKPKEISSPTDSIPEALSALIVGDIQTALQSAMQSGLLPPLPGHHKLPTITLRSHTPSQQRETHSQLSSSIGVVYASMLVPKHIKKASKEPSQAASSTTLPSDSPVMSAFEVAQIILQKIPASTETPYTASVAPSGHINISLSEAKELSSAATTTTSSTPHKGIPSTVTSTSTVTLTSSSAKSSKSSQKLQEAITALPSVPPVHKFDFQLHPAHFTQEEFDLYRRYSIAVHKKDTNEKSYTEFLCDSPLVSEGPSAGHPLGLGSFHGHMRIDGVLVGVCVIDILTEALLSVYFFYDPNLSYLSLGVVSVLQEIELARLAMVPHYHMVFYIHTCSKMNYKRHWYPSELLTDQYTWIPLDKACLAALDRDPHTKLSTLPLAMPQSTTTTPLPTATTTQSASATTAPPPPPPPSTATTPAAQPPPTMEQIQEIVDSMPLMISGQFWVLRDIGGVSSLWASKSDQDAVLGILQRWALLGGPALCGSVGIQVG
ncbi:arginyl-tRNA--protein transferase 2 [Pelomyxa schiedti]|nr:arginyl-tRNA--protein transferase 2 [Pelomyxa schiedti]